MPVTQVGTQDIPLTDLRQFPGNARRGNLAEIRKSIKRYGQYRSLVVRHHDGQYTILAGNNTAQGLAAEGYETARCEVLECTDDDATRINTADNRLPELAEIDDKALLAQLTGLGDLDGTGYSLDDMDELRRLTGAFGQAATAFLNDFTTPPPAPGAAPTLPGPWPEPPPGSDQGDGSHLSYSTSTPEPPPPGQPVPSGPEWVQLAWVVTPGHRETIRQAVTHAQQAGGLATGAEGLLAVAAHYLNSIGQ